MGVAKRAALLGEGLTGKAIPPPFCDSRSIQVGRVPEGRLGLLPRSARVFAQQPRCHQSSSTSSAVQAKLRPLRSCHPLPDPHRIGHARAGTGWLSRHGSKRHIPVQDHNAGSRATDRYAPPGPGPHNRSPPCLASGSHFGSALCFLAARFPGSPCSPPGHKQIYPLLGSGNRVK